MTDQFTGQLLDGKYLIRQKLGEGGMGAVYLGEHAAMGKKVAVKLLHSFFVTNEEVVKRFFREARAAAAISHRNIIDVLDMGVTPTGEPFLVMEYLEGADVESVMNKQPIPLATACAILEPTLAAIGAAHAKGVVHRDLKPENIFINKPVGTDAEIKLIDFGISKFQDNAATKLTVEGTTMGTPAYMSPEQAKGAKELNHTTDIYAVGVIFYEMLCGDTPYEGETYNELFANMLTTEPRHPQQVYPAFPMEAWPIIEKAIAKNPAERFQSADEMMQAIDALCPAAHRQAAMKAVGNGITAPEVAAGDLGPELTGIAGRATAASDILSDIVRQSTQHIGGATVMAGSDDTAEKTMLATAQDTALLTPPSEPVVARAKHLLLAHPKKNLYRIGAGVSLFILVALTIGLCGNDGGSESVEIKIVDAPPAATIFYNDSMVTENPFRVEQGDTLVPLRIEFRGKTRMNISITPDSNQEITYSPIRRQAAVKVEKTDPPPEAAPASEAPPEPAVSQKKKKSASSSEPAREPADAGGEASGGGGGDASRNPFKRLGNRLRGKFND